MIGFRPVTRLRQGDGGHALGQASSRTNLDTEWPLGSPTMAAPGPAGREAGLGNGEVQAPAATA